MENMENIFPLVGITSLIALALLCGFARGLVVFVAVTALALVVSIPAYVFAGWNGILGIFILAGCILFLDIVLGVMAQVAAIFPPHAAPPMPTPHPLPPMPTGEPRRGSGGGVVANVPRPTRSQEEECTK